MLGVLELELDAGDEIVQVGANAAEFVGLNGEFSFGRGGDADSNGCFDGTVVRDIETQESARSGETEFGGWSFGILADEIEGAKSCGGDANLPLVGGPVDQARGIRPG